MWKKKIGEKMRDELTRLLIEIQKNFFFFVLCECLEYKKTGVGGINTTNRIRINYGNQ